MPRKPKTHHKPRARHRPAVAHTADGVKFQTKGTRLTWKTAAEWLVCYESLLERQSRQRTRDAIEAHLTGLYFDVLLVGNNRSALARIRRLLGEHPAKGILGKDLGYFLNVIDNRRHALQKPPRKPVRGAGVEGGDFMAMPLGALRRLIRTTKSAERKKQALAALDRRSKLGGREPRAKPGAGSLSTISNGADLADVLERLEIKPAALADRLGSASGRPVSRTTVWRWLNGKAEVPAGVAAYLLLLLEIGPAPRD